MKSHRTSRPVSPLYVGPKGPRHTRRKGKQRSTPHGELLASEFMRSIALSGRTRSCRAKRSSGKARATFDILLINSSIRPQLAAAMEISQGVSVFANQEHQCSRHAFVDLQYAARDLGWKIVGAPAHLTPKEGYSAGVSIVAKSEIGIGAVGKGFDHSPPSAPGRVAAAWLRVGPRSGMLIISALPFSHRHACAPLRHAPYSDELCRSHAHAYLPVGLHVLVSCATVSLQQCVRRRELQTRFGDVRHATSSSTALTHLHANAHTRTRSSAHMHAPHHPAHVHAEHLNTH